MEFQVYVRNAQERMVLKDLLRRINNRVVERDQRKPLAAECLKEALEFYIAFLDAN